MPNREKVSLKDYMKHLDRIKEIEGYVFRHDLSPDEFYTYKINSKRKESGKIMLEISPEYWNTIKNPEILQPLSQHFNDELVRKSNKK